MLCGSSSTRLNLVIICDKQKVQCPDNLLLLVIYNLIFWMTESFGDKQ